MNHNAIMEVIINNKKTDTASTTIDELATELLLPERGVALAVNNRVVARNLWSSTLLSAGDSITIIKAAFGG